VQENKKDMRLLKKEEIEQIYKNQDKITLDGKTIFQKVLKNKAGVTNYLTRDIAALKFRKEHLKVDYIMYLT
jgi:arginyl-tRNA synthetase